MHLVEKLQSIYRCSPKKPNLSFNFLPLPFEKYITILNDGLIPSNTYDYFDDVVDDISGPLANNNIRIVQILQKQDQKRIKSTYHLAPTNLAQLNYVVKNSLLHVSSDAYSTELCGTVGANSLSLAGNRYKGNFYPFFNPSAKMLSNCLYKKPTFNAIETPKSINGIKTEKVSKAILESLNLTMPTPYKTIFVGSKYPDIEIDYVPNFILNSSLFSKFVVNVRLDKEFNLANVQTCFRPLRLNLVTDQKIPAQFLYAIKNNVETLTYILRAQTPKDIADSCLDVGIEPQFLCFNKSKIDEIRFRFLDFKVRLIEHDQPKLEIPRDAILKSSKIILSNNEKYLSYAHLEKGEKIGIINRIIDNKKFWEDQDYYKIITPDDNKKDNL